MTNEQKREIYDYCTPPKIVSVMGVIVIALSPLLYFIVKSVKNDDLMAITGGIAMVLVGLLFLSLRPWYGANVSKTLKKHEEDNGSGKIYYDFKNGSRIANDTIICGERYLFCKGMGVAVYCTDIAEIKLVIKDYKFIPVSDMIVVRLKGKEKIVLRSLPHENRNRRIFGDIIREISKRCPDAETNI